MQSNLAEQLTADDTLPLRISVGVVVFNADGQVWVGRRKPKWFGDHSAKIWQLPQGGIEKFEPPRIAALRELREETGMTSVEIIGEHHDWIECDLPDDLVGVALKGRYRGQRMKWFAMRFHGDASEIELGGQFGTKAEFESWRWAPIDLVPKLIVPYRRPLYEQVANSFQKFSTPLAS